MIQSKLLCLLKTIKLDEINLVKIRNLIFELDQNYYFTCIPKTLLAGIIYFASLENSCNRMTQKQISDLLKCCVLTVRKGFRLYRKYKNNKN